jgi:hypothetical protein
LKYPQAMKVLRGRGQHTRRWRGLERWLPVQKLSILIACRCLYQLGRYVELMVCWGVSRKTMQAGLCEEEVGGDGQTHPFALGARLALPRKGGTRILSARIPLSTRWCLEHGMRATRALSERIGDL